MKALQMKNPFKKEDDHTVLIAAIGVGVAVGSTLAYLFLTEKGATYRKQISDKFKDVLSDKAADVVSKKTIIPKKAAKAAVKHAVK